MTAEERTRIQEAACRYVREQAPTPPIAVLERVARIVLQAQSPQVGISVNPGEPEAA